MKIKVILADDHAIVLHGIRAILAKTAPDIEIIGEAANGRELLELVKTRTADVYVIDISMPVMDGNEALEELLKFESHARIVMLSMYKDKAIIQQSFLNGARGYILKECATDEIYKAITDVFHGKYYLSPSIAGYVTDGTLSPSGDFDSQASSTILTSRQKEILKYVCEGKTEKDIAEILNISPFTVHVHKNNIMKNLDIHTTAGLVRYGIKNGIVFL